MVKVFNNRAKKFYSIQTMALKRLEQGFCFSWNWEQKVGKLITNKEEI